MKSNLNSIQDLNSICDKIQLNVESNAKVKKLTEENNKISPIDSSSDNAIIALAVSGF